MSNDTSIFRGGLVLPMAAGSDPVICDVLVMDGQIAEIGPDLRLGEDVTSPTEIDATGCIVMPGLVDTHRHVWPTLLRGVTSDWSFREFLRVIRYQAPRFFRAEDMRIGNELGMTEALNAGVTTVLDFSHCIKSPAHADALIAGTRASGIRSAFHLGLMDVFGLDEAEPDLLGSFEDRAAHLGQVAAGWRNDGLVTLGVALSRWLFAEAEPDRTRQEIELARGLGLRITAHIQTVPHDPAVGTDIGRLAGEGLLADDMTLVHLVHSPDEDIDLAVAAGAGIAMCPTSCMISGEVPPLKRVHDAGGSWGLGIDLVPHASGSMLAEARAAVLGQRTLSAVTAGGELPLPSEFPAETVVRAATIGGARAMGLGDRIGTLEVGKEADIIMVRGDSLRTFPVIDPYRTLVFQVEAEDVDTVMVSGRLRKRDGRMLADIDDLMSRARESHAHLMGRWATIGGLDPAADIDVGF